MCRRAPGVERPDPRRPLLPVQPAAHAGVRHGRDRRAETRQLAGRHRGLHQVSLRRRVTLRSTLFYIVKAVLTGLSRFETIPI